MHISDKIRYVGVDDLDIDLFEGQYEVPEGVSYNSYLIKGDKVAVMDTVDETKSAEWEKNLEAELAGAEPDYLVVLHVEPDHGGSVKVFLDKYKNATLVTSAKGVQFLEQFFPGYDFTKKLIIVKEGDVLDLGSHKLAFVAAPMVHWPEVLMAYESTEKVLFSADGFGKFGALHDKEGNPTTEYKEDGSIDDWSCEARRYYFNIVGKYGAQVQAVLKKAAGLDIQVIAPLHGPVIKKNLAFHIGLYDTWSKYEAESKGVFIAYTSLHGNTAKAALELKAMIEKRGVKVSAADLARDDMHEAVEDAFRYDRMILAAPTYDGGVAPKMEDFLSHLKAKTYRNRRVGLMENGTWAPMAAKVMRGVLETLKDITIEEPVVSIKSVVNADSRAQMEALAEVMSK